MKEHLIIISIVIMIMITLGNIMMSYYNGLQASKQLDQQYQAQQHLIMNDELLLASIKEGQKTNQQQNILTSVLNESLAGEYPLACPPPCHRHHFIGSAIGPWLMLNESNPGKLDSNQTSQNIHLTLALPDHIQFVDKYGDIIHLVR